MSCFKPKVFSGFYVLCVLLHSVSAETGPDSRSNVFLDLRAALAELAGQGRSFVGRLAEEQTVVSVRKAFSQVLGVGAGGLAAALNVLLQYLVGFLKAAGVQVALPVRKVTPEGLIFVGQWLLVALICYWVTSLAFRLVASTVRRALWLLKMGVALACFALILSDHRAGPETTAIRLAVLVCVCVLLGVGASGGADAKDKTAQLEEQVQVLERRLGQMERWTRTDE